MFAAVPATSTVRPGRSARMCARLPSTVNVALRGARSTLAAAGSSSGARRFASIDRATAVPAGAARSSGASCAGVIRPTRLPLNRSGIGSASSCCAFSSATLAAAVVTCGARCRIGTLTAGCPASAARPIVRSVVGVSKTRPLRASMTRAEPSDFTTRRASRGSDCRPASCSGRNDVLERRSGAVDLRRPEVREQPRLEASGGIASSTARSRSTPMPLALGTTDTMPAAVRTWTGRPSSSPICRASRSRASLFDSPPTSTPPTETPGWITSRVIQAFAPSPTTSSAAAAEPRMAACRTHGRRRFPYTV